jgi:glycosyltransferase involved in cell wall biosynthesis
MLTVIIPTRNRAIFLKSVLKSLELQTYPKDLFEVLVIDNGSADNTKQVVESARQQLVNLHYFYEPTPGLHVGRNLGMKMAKSDILVYGDDDIEAFPTWLEGISDAFRDEEVMLVGGKVLPKFEVPPPLWIQQMWNKNKQGFRSIVFLSILDLGDEIMIINPLYIYGCNFSVRKSVLNETDGFHPDAMPDELIRYRGDGESYVSRYIKQKGYKAVYHPKASIYHSIAAARLTRAYFCRRAYLQGISDSYSILRNGAKPSCTLLKRIISAAKSALVNNLISLKYNNMIFSQSYIRGFLMHQREAHRNKSLYHWITKDHYLH